MSDRRVEYETAGLDAGDLAPDPIAQWRRWYDEAVSAGVTEPNAAVLSTVGADGWPSGRYVLVRGADERGFAVYTNLSSPKSVALAATARAALTFGWLELHRQARVVGAVERVADEEADAYFASRPRGSRLGAWASPQSEVLPDRAELDRRVAEVAARFGEGEVPRPPGWGGWRVVPLEVEVWQGRPSRLHDRFRWRRAAVGAPWSPPERLAP